MKERLKLVDLDGDSLDCSEVWMPGPMLALFVLQEKDESGMLLEVESARKLRDFLDKFISKNEVSQ